ncbi:MAG TPA: VWA domain-containing protein [Acidobacteriota bacterium]|nr:VWA domain-containing protein [Acidobacteriota bacterium]
MAKARFRNAVLLPLIILAACIAGFSAGDKSDVKTVQRRTTFRAGVDMVVLRAAVTDPLNRYVTGLEKQHFKVFDNKVEQAISHFSNDDAALSVGVIFDRSGSMADKIVNAKNSVVRFLEKGTMQDEYFLVTFNDQVSLAQDFTSKADDIRNQIALLQGKGRTAIYDAIYAGLQKMTQAHNDKKALIIITDGEDNSSRYTFSDVKELAKESDAQIYVVGEKGDLGYGRGIISELVSLTGGRAFFPDSLKQIDYYCDLIHTELRNQYLLGYVPSNATYDGRWHKLKVQLEPPAGLPKLSVRAKEGYFAPKR